MYQEPYRQYPAGCPRSRRFCETWESSRSSFERKMGQPAFGHYNFGCSESKLRDKSTSRVPRVSPFARPGKVHAVLVVTFAPSGRCLGAMRETTLSRASIDRRRGLSPEYKAGPPAGDAEGGHFLGLAKSARPGVPGNYFCGRSRERWASLPGKRTRLTSQRSCPPKVLGGQHGCGIFIGLTARSMKSKQSLLWNLPRSWLCQPRVSWQCRRRSVHSRW